MDQPDIVNKLRFINEQFVRSYKCLNLDRSTKEEIVEKLTKILFDKIEEVKNVLNAHYSKLTVAHISAAGMDLRNKLLHVLSRRGLEVNISNYSTRKNSTLC